MADLNNLSLNQTGDQQTGNGLARDLPSNPAAPDSQDTWFTPPEVKAEVSGLTVQSDPISAQTVSAAVVDPALEAAFASNADADSWFVPPEAETRVARLIEESTAANAPVTVASGTNGNTDTNTDNMEVDTDSEKPREMSALASESVDMIESVPAAVGVATEPEPVTDSISESLSEPATQAEPDVQQADIRADVNEPIESPQPALSAPTISPEGSSDVNNDTMNNNPNRTPDASPAPKGENLPEGAGISTEVDYSNYVPGRGFVPKSETSATPPAPVQPTGSQVTDAQPVQVAVQPAEAQLPPTPPRPAEAQPITDPVVLADAARMAAASPANQLDQPVNVNISVTPGASAAVGASAVQNNIPVTPNVQVLPPDTPPPATGVVQAASAAPLPNSASVQTPAAQPVTPPPPVAQPPIQPTGSVAADLARPPANPALQQRFLDVERAVKGLRRRYQTGMISRNDLQAELRKLMFTDEGGKYWMLGMESDNWYQFDGQTWALATPPGYTGGIKPAAMAVTPDAAPRTSADPGPRTNDANFGEQPLPRSVPVYDDGATIVGKAAPRLDNTLREPNNFNRRLASERARQGGNPAGSQAGFEAGMTVPGRAVSGAVTQPGAAVSAGFAGGYGNGGFGGAAAIPAPVAEPLQPDYGPKPKGFTANRQQLGGCLIRGALVGTFAALALAILGILGAVIFYNSTIGRYSESIGDLSTNIDNKTQSVTYYDGSGREIYRQNDPNLGSRTRVPLADISPYLIHAVISTENERFYEDPGFDIVAIGRALVQNVITSGNSGGASTITQQLTRNEVLEAGAASDRSATRKINEILVSSEVARRYTKSQIMEYYLNTVYFGNLAYGAEAAARVYFNKSAKDLTLVEASYLAGLIQSPVSYDPAADRGASSVYRASVVRGLMVERGCVQMEHAPYNTEPFCVTSELLNRGENIRDSALLVARMASFRPTIAPATYPHFVQYVNAQLDELFPGGAIFTGGYKVYTTIDPTIQDLSQAAVTAQLANIARNNARNAAVLVIRPSDGAILAMVGSADFNNVAIDGQVNVTTAPRQPGSTLKPFIYTAAMERDGNNNYWSAGQVIWDVPTTFGNNYTPVNYDGRFHGPQIIRNALANSYNIPAVKALDYVTIARFKEFSERLGITYPLVQPEQGGLPMALGGVETRMIDVVRAYSVYANQGKRVPSFAISRITRRAADGTDEVVYQYEPPEGSQVVEPSLTWIISEFLSDNAARTPAFGANSPLNTGNYKTAVKTGTSNDYRDNWTIGYNPDYVVGVWVGNTKGEPMTNVSGVTGAAPIWRAIMLGALNGKPGNWYQRPAGVQEALICADFGTIAFQECRNQRNEFYWQPNPPPGPENIFVRRRVDTFTGQIANANCPNFAEERTFLNITDQSAISWLRSAQGAQFLANYNLTQPLATPPTTECPAGQPQPDLQIVQPQEGQQVSGNVQVTGVVSIPAFSRYQIELTNDPAGNNWQIVYGPSTAQVLQANSFLGGWDSTRVPDGQYLMRVVGYDQQGQNVQLRRTINVNNTNPQASNPGIVNTPIQIVPGATATPFILDPFATPVTNDQFATPVVIGVPTIGIVIATFTPEVPIQVVPVDPVNPVVPIVPVATFTPAGSISGGNTGTIPSTCALSILAAVPAYSDYTLQAQVYTIQAGNQVVVLADAGGNVYGLDPTGANAANTPFSQLWWVRIDPTTGSLTGNCTGLASPVGQAAGVSTGNNFAPVQ